MIVQIHGRIQSVNTHKTAVVTLPNGQGTRNVEVPVKVYPVANAKAPSRDVKGQNSRNGTDAMMTLHLIQIQTQMVSLQHGK